MKGYNMKGIRFRPNKKMKCKFKPMYHPLERLKVGELKTLNQWNRADVEQSMTETADGKLS